MITPSPRQRALALRAWHEWQQKNLVVAKCYHEQPFEVADIKHEHGVFYFLPRAKVQGWIGAQHLESITVTRVH